MCLLKDFRLENVNTDHDVVQVMEEIMAKSKAYKAEKAKQKEEDFDAADKLDEELAEIMQSGGLSAFIKPKGRKEKDKGSVAEEDAAYDARREMVFDSKAKVINSLNLFRIIEIHNMAIQNQYQQSSPGLAWQSLTVGLANTFQNKLHWSICRHTSEQIWCKCNLFVSANNMPINRNDMRRLLATV